jgi:hypothetical protein
MSYSFTVKGGTIAKALANAAAAFDKMAETQSIHKRDRDAALANAANIANCLGAVPDGKVVIVAMNGSLGWTGSYDEQKPDDVTITSASSSASAYFTDPNVDWVASVQGEL